MFRKSSSREPIMKADIQQDWADREFIQHVQYNFVKIATFLNKFDIITRYKLGEVYERLSHLERQMDLLENSILPLTSSGDGQGSTTSSSPSLPVAERPSLRKKPQIPALQEEEAARAKEAQAAKSRLEEAKRAEEELLAQQRAELEKLRKYTKQPPPTAAVPPTAAPPSGGPATVRPIPPPPEEFQNDHPGMMDETEDGYLPLEPPPEPPLEEDGMDPPPPPDEDEFYAAPPPPML